jgi:O-methyltransferase
MNATQAALTEPSAADRYLEVMRPCLTRYGLGDDLEAVVPSTARRRRAWRSVEAGLARYGLVVRRRRPGVDAVREVGGDWPGTAETMIGLRRLENLQQCIEQVLADDVPGDLLEAGVWRGGAGIFMRAVLVARGASERTVWMADSFAGLPRPRPGHAADVGDEHWTYSQLAVDLEQVKANVARYGLLDDGVRFLPGWFSDTLPTAPVERLAVLRADGDMYGSTMDILTALYPKLSPGGFLIVDDYHAVEGCRQAVEEYRSEHGITDPMVTIDWAGVYWRKSS